VSGGGEEENMNGKKESESLSRSQVRKTSLEKGAERNYEKGDKAMHIRLS